jgi:hypothetical protein
MADKSDATKDPEFQKVVRHFVTTPHKSHKPLGECKGGAGAKAGQPKKRRAPIKDKAPQ